MKRIISEKVLLNTLHMYDLHTRQLELIEEMAKVVRRRRAQIAECIRANYTGDKAVFEVVAPAIGSQKMTRQLYDTEFGTLQWVRRVREWAKAKENQREEG